jgi:Spy/CpxP family protein refolding chaperone
MLIRMIPAETPKIEAMVARHRPRLRELRGDAMRARAESFRLLTDTNFDSAAFAKSLAAVQTADAALETETMRLTADSVAVLTPQERALVASKVQKPDRIWLRRFFGRR